MNKSYNIGTLKLTKFENEKSSSFQITKSYKDKKTGEWKESKSLFLEDLLKLQALINKVTTETVVERMFNSNNQQQNVVDQQPVENDFDDLDSVPF